jgi:hypothetical protein
MKAQRNFLLVATLAAAAATPAVGQTVAPAVASGDSNKGAASIPDFSGIWAHLSWPDFEPPLAGPAR